MQSISRHLVREFLARPVKNFFFLVFIIFFLFRIFARFPGNETLALFGNNKSNVSYNLPEIKMFQI